MFNKKQLYLIGALALALSLALSQGQVLAQWKGPDDGPGGATKPLLTNPLEENLDLGGKNITNGGASFNENVDLNNKELKQVGKINGVVPVFGGGITDKLTSNLSGQDMYAITNLKGCDPAKDISCAGLTSTAGKNSFDNTKTFAIGVWGKTSASSGANPTYAVYGEADFTNSKGVGVTGSGQTGVFGYTQNLLGYGGFFQNGAFGGVALGFLGGVSGDLSSDSFELTNGDFNFNAATKQFSINADDIYINGEVFVSAGEYGVYAIADSAADGGFAGVQGVGGEVGVAGSGPIGVMGDGFYGGIFSGERLEGWGPPPPGGWGNPPPSDDPLFSLFGINKTLAGVNDPGYIGLVAAGGYMYGGSFSNAGLGLCAISGELIHDEVDDSNYFAYCQDGDGTNNYAGFFAGNVYIKKGSIQINDTLAAAGENLIYGNIENASANGSSLIKLQTGEVDKFRVAKDGATTFSNLILNKNLGATDNLIFANLDSAVAGSNFIDLQVLNSSKFKVTRDGVATFGSTIISPASLRLTGASSMIDFDDGGNTGPTCDNSNIGVIYYFNTNRTLCVCNGTGKLWDALSNVEDKYCSNTVPPPS